MQVLLKLAAFCLLVVSLLVGCDQVGGSNALENKLKSGQPFFSIAYTRPFASRFNLPVSGLVVLPDYLRAVSVEINEVNNRFTCDLHLYIDSSLDIFIPAKGEYFSEKTEAEQFFISSYNDRDQQWNSSLLDDNSMRIRFESRESVDPDHRFVKTLGYKRVHKNFLPGLTLLSFDTHCDIFEPDYFPADVWIQKSGFDDYRLGDDQPGSTKQLDKNYQFEIPVSLVEQMQPFLQLAFQQNAKRKGW